MTNYSTDQPRRPAWLIPFAFLIVALVALALILLLVTGDDSSDSTSEGTVAGSEAPVTEAPSENPCSSFTETSEEPFQLCDSGPAVEQIQVALTRHGFPVDADGFYGPDTEAAVIAFQQSKGLEADGIVGPDTIAALDE